VVDVEVNILSEVCPESERALARERDRMYLLSLKPAKPEPDKVTENKKV
jgi:hypothetical protein